MASGFQRRPAIRQKTTLSGRLLLDPSAYVWDPLGMSKRNRVAALIRVSTDKQDVDVQRQQIERWATAHDLPVSEWFEEHATSGTASKRPTLDRLLADARRGRIGTLVVVALDRLGRSAIAVMNHLHELDAAGVRVVSLRESLDFGTAAGRLVASVLAHVAEIERDNLRARTRAGIAAARKRGAKIGRPRLVWTDAKLDELRDLRETGQTWAEIEASNFRVFDSHDRAVKPSVRAMRRALAG